MITFFKAESWNSNKDGVCFYAERDGEMILCRVSRQALIDIFVMDRSDRTPASPASLECFEANRELFQDKAEVLINDGLFEHDGSKMFVQIRSAKLL
jgi:hypothetical protein